MPGEQRGETIARDIITVTMVMRRRRHRGAQRDDQVRQKFAEIFALRGDRCRDPRVCSVFTTTAVSAVCRGSSRASR